MRDDADMKIIMKELIKIMQKIQTSSENTGGRSVRRSSISNIQGIQLQLYDENQETVKTYLIYGSLCPLELDTGATLTSNVTGYIS
jgi:hypothetical protein